MWIAGGLVLLLGVAYFVVTSGGFIKSFVLPKVATAINADLSVGDLQLRPFSQVVLRDVKFTPKGAETLLTAGEMRARYSLMSIIGGKIAVEEVSIANPTITLIEKADGTSNLDPLLKSTKPAEKKETKPAAKPAAPPTLDIKSVKLSNATVRQTKQLKSGGSDVLELTGVNLTASDIRNGQAGKLDLSAAIGVAKAAQGQAGASSLAAKLAGAFIFSLTADLMPSSLKGETTLTVDKATGDFADAALLNAKLEAEASPTEIRQLTVRFSKADVSLGELRVSGPFDASKREGKLKVELAGVDRKLLNIVGAASGLDFGTTTVSAATDVELAKAGALISAAGRLELARFQVTRESQTTPTLDLKCDYGVVVDNAAKSAQLKSLALAGTQNQRTLLAAALAAPMTIAWGNTADAVGDSSLTLTVNALDLADWKPFLGGVAPAGTLNVQGKLLSKQAGKLLEFDATASGENLVVLAGTNRYAGLKFNVEAKGQASDMKQLKLPAWRAQLAQNGQQVLSAEGAGACDTVAKTADANAIVLVALPSLLTMLALPDVAASGGAVELQAQVTHKDKTDGVTGKLLLVGFTGEAGATKLNDFGLETGFDFSKTGDKAHIRKAAGKVTSRGQPGGEFEMAGNYDLASKAGDVALKLAGFNQSGLAPFLASALGDKKLVSVAVNSTISASLAANGDASAKADLQVANLVVSDPQGALPATPLEARFQADASVAKQVAQVRQLQLSLTPTDRAKNQLGLTGSVDFSKSNAITGDLKLAAESLDFTRYYDLFAGNTNATAAKSSSPAGAPATDPTREPDAVKLPFQNFTFDASIGRLFLREVAISNLLATLKLDGGHVVVKPCHLTLNGAPVSATVDADLGVPGFKYDVAFNADKVPLAPLVNSFVPDRKGQMGGTTTANAQLKGAGVTGAGLQKNLNGQFSLLCTNMNLSIADARSPLVNSIINIVVGIPELLRNPAAGLGTVLGSLTGQRTKSGWADELTARPIDVIAARGNAAGGQLALQQAELRSAAFQAQAAGNVTFAPILTNSVLSFPVHVALGRPYAEKIGLVTASTPTNLAYIALPEFVRMKGTLGEPKPDINKLALVALAAQTSGGLVKQVGGAGGEKTANILSAVGGLLGGGTQPAATAPSQPAAATNATPTNAPQPQPINLLDLFGQPKKKK